MRKWIMILAIVALASSSFAAEQKVLQIDLRSAIKMALDQNPSMASAKEVEAIAKAGIRRAESSDAWRLNANSSYSYVSKPTLFGGMTVLDRNTNMNTLSASKPIYTGGLSQALKDRARWGWESSHEQTAVAQEDMILVVTETYIQALNAKENLRVADDAVASLQANLDAAVKLKEAGTVPKSDVYRAETESASAKEAQIQAQTEYKTQLARLRDLLGVNPDTDLEMSNTLPQLSDENLSAGSAHERPEIRAAEGAVKAAEANVKRAKAGRRPQVSANADFLNIGVGAEFPRRSDTVSAGISVSLPVLDGGVTAADIEEAKSALRKAQSDLQVVQQKVKLEQEEAQFALESADARMASSEARVKSAKESERALKVSYVEGIAPITDVLAARAALTEAESARVNSLYDRYAAQVLVLKATGRVNSLLGTTR